MKIKLIRHLIATPETIQSLITQGQFPTDLAEYVSPKVVRLFDFKKQPAFSSHSSSAQTFIIELILELDSDDPITQIHEQSKYIHMRSINFNHITCVYVYSERAKKLFISLLGIQYSKLAVIDPLKFNNHTQVDFNNLTSNTDLVSYKRESENEKKEELTESQSHSGFFKKLKSDKNINEDIESASPVVTNPHSTLLRLSTRNDHRTFLNYAFKKAKKSILITSYSLESETFKILNLFSLIMKARQRGILVYIYYSDQKEVDTDVLQFLQDFDVYLDNTYTHSKLFIVDDSIVSVGSFNWLSSVSDKYPESCEGTIVLQNHLMCFDLKEDLWAHIKRYRNIQFNNEREIEKFEVDMANFDSIEYPIDETSMMVYLPTLDQQRGYLTHSLETAKKSIIICSPFISSGGEFINDFDLDTLTNLSKKEVQVIFVCDANNQNINEFRDFLNKLDSPFIHLVSATNFHLKTIIVDDKEISEGSFNWLSAVRHEGSQYHNHEAVLVIEGNMALSLIQHFHASSIGKAIKDYFKQQATNNEPTKLRSLTSYYSF